MNSKYLLASLLLLALFASAVQGLTIRQGQNHKTAQQITENLLTGFEHLMFSALHQSQPNHYVDGQIKTTVGQLLQFDIKKDLQKDITSFMLGDKEINDNFKNEKPLSPEADKRFKNFLHNNKNYNYDMLSLLNDEKSVPKCIKDLGVQKKKKIISITLDSADLKLLLNNKYSDKDLAKYQAVEKSIKDAIRNDKDLGESVAKCISDKV